jgi:hypothetical protein
LTLSGATAVPWSVRLRLLLAAFSVGAACTAAAACGLDENGLMGDAAIGNDVTAPDVSQDVGPPDAPIDVVQGCTTLDASACFDGSLPQGWTFAAVALASQGCPSTAYTASTYIYNPTPMGGACTCGCTNQGDYTCAGTLTAGGNDNSCSAPLVVDAGADGCVNTGWGDHHATADWQPTGTGTPTCTGTVSGDGGWTASTATSCAPGCSATDFCTLTSPFMRCIVSTTSTSCPTEGPFTVQQPPLGTAANVGVTCAGCGCAVSAPAACTGTIVAHDQPNCGGSHSFTVDNTCQDTGHAFASFSYAATPTNPATCSITDGGTGTAAFGNSLTVCCIPP